MSEEISFEVQLRQAVNSRSRQLGQGTIAEIKESWRAFQANLESVYSLLLKKGLLREDPYKKDRKVTEIVAPKDAHLSESNKEEEVSIRLSEFTAVVDFMNNYSSFSVETLNLKQIKNLHGILNFISFTDFTPNSAKKNHTTRALAEFTNKIKKRSDQLTAGAMQSNLDQLNAISKRLEQNLKDISVFKREEYKLQVREEILGGLDLDNSVTVEIFMSEIRKQFQHHQGQIPYFPELLQEIHAEEFSKSGKELREKILSSLSAQKKDSKPAAAKADLKPLLTEALKILANSTRHMDTALEKMQANHGLLNNRPKSFMEKFKKWIIQLTNGKEERIIYEIELVDPATSAHITKNLDYNNFMANTAKKAKGLNALLQKSSPLVQKLATASEEQLFSFLDKTYREISDINKTMDALDTYFKAETDRYARDKIRGVKNEVAAIKGNLQTTSQKKHEYVAKKEEADQLRRLGID